MQNKSLSTQARGYALAARFTMGVEKAVARCRKRAAPLGDYLERVQREGLAAVEVAALDRSTPAGFEDIHPSWYEPVPLSSRPEARTALERLHYGHLLPMVHHARTDELGGRAALLERLAARSDELPTLLCTLGRRRLAVAFSGAPRAALAQLCARVGEPAASQLLAEIRSLPSLQVEEVRAAQRALFIGRGRRGPLVDASAASAEMLFQRIGCAFVGPALGDLGEPLERLAQRLPRVLGEQLLTESRTSADESERAVALRAAAQLLSAPPRTRIVCR